MGKIKFNPPVLAVVTGVPCSGKTALSGSYYGDVRVGPGVLDYVETMIYLNKDMINDGFTKERAGEVYHAIREGTYIAIDNFIESNLGFGNSIWIDATYAAHVQDPSWADRFRKPVQATGAKLKIIRCIADEDVIRERMIKRGYERDRWKLEHWEEFLEEEPIIVGLPPGAIEIDTGRYPLEDNVRTAIAFMEE